MGRCKTCLVPGVLLGLFAACASAQQTWYVDDDGSGGDGTSWAQAFAHLQDGLGAAGAGDVVRVAQGTYRADRSAASPGGTGNRDASFMLADGVTVLGGYAGVGASNPDERDPAAYVTVLSGDLDGNDGPDFANRSDNTRHVLSGVGEGVAPVIDGFTVIGGYADGGEAGPRGAGMLIDGASPAVSHCTFIDNGAETGGAIAMFAGAAPDFTECAFEANGAVLELGGSQDGGAVSAVGGAGSFTRCMFKENTALDFGGALFCEFDSDPTLISCVFDSNGANFGAGVNASASSSPAFYNCLFVANDGNVTGGAARCVSSANAIFGNCTFYANQANFGAVLFAQTSQSSPPTVANSIVLGNEGLSNQFFSPDGSYAVLFSCVEGGVGGIGNIDADPMMADPAGGDFTLLEGSPCIDAGTNTKVPENLLDDLAGNPRLTDDPDTQDTGVGPAPIVDMGVYELPVSCAADYNGDGVLNVLDFVAFQIGWTSGDDAADCDGSGQFNVLDFVCFQKLFQAGCD